MSDVYNTFEDMVCSHDNCFICGDALKAENSSVEHIIPKWLQNKFALWNEELTLLNDTSIKYKNLTIPCCVQCNGTFLSVLENDIRNAVNGGFKKFKKIDEELVIKWVSKIKYSLLFKELSLKADRRSPNSKMIISTDVLKELKLTHTLLQSIRFSTKFHGVKPWSVILFEIYDEANTYYCADYVIGNVFCMQLGSIGLIATFFDCGINKNIFMEHFPIFTQIKLHQIQFQELCAKVHYKESTRIKYPLIQVRMPNTNSPSIDFITMDMSGNVYGEWKQKEYAKVLEHHWRNWGVTYDEIYAGGDLVITFLKTDNGNIRKYNSSSLTDFEDMVIT